MFPITYKNRFIYKVQDDPHWAADKLRYHLYQGLKKEGAENVHVIDKMIRFDGNPWHIGVRWHFFHMISKGKITADYRNNHLGMANLSWLARRMSECVPAYKQSELKERRLFGMMVVPQPSSSGDDLCLSTRRP